MDIFVKNIYEISNAKIIFLGEKKYKFVLEQIFQSNSALKLSSFWLVLRTRLWFGQNMVCDKQKRMWYVITGQR